MLTKERRSKVKKYGALFVSLVLLVVTRIAYADPGVEELIQVLKEKGVITQEEMEKIKVRVEEKEKKEKSLKAYYKEGFFLETSDKNFTLKVGGRAHVDYYGLDPDGRDDSSFDIKRARIYAEGALFKNTEFKAEIDFSEGSDATLTDGYINFSHLPFAKIQLGQFKEPFGLEVLTSFRFVDFVERSIISTQIAPARDIGIMLHSDLFGGLMGYGLGIFNGNGRNRKRDENDDKDVGGRLYLRPFIKGGLPFLERLSFLEGLQIGGAFTWGNQEGGVRNILVPASETRFVTWASGVRSDDSRWRLGAELAWVLGSFSLKGEWMRMEWTDLQLRNQMKDLDVDGWYVSASWFLTGEKEVLRRGVFGRITPLKNFSPTKGGWGAWQLAARFESFDVDKNIFNRGYAAGTDGVNSFTFGVNWYPHNMLRVSLNYVRNEYDDNLVDLKRDDQEDLFLTRFQVDF